MTVRQAEEETRNRLSQIRAENETRWFMQHALGYTWERYLLRLDCEMPPDIKKRLNILITERLQGKPLQYVLGEWSFMGFPVHVREGVLIPRDDTETLAETAVEIAQQSHYTTCLDLCCGSGCIGVAIAKLTNMQVSVADIESVAISLAKENALLNNASVKCMQSNLFDNIEGVFDLIVSNPPYIRTGDIESLDSAVRDYEPKLALDGGVDGLDFYRKITRDAVVRLNPGGALLFEVGYDQADTVINILKIRGYSQEFTRKDMNGIKRVVGAFWFR